MIPLPSKPKIIFEEGTKAIIEIEGLYPGYGHTIGNSLRRVLLSSLNGAVITSIKIAGVGHEFSMIEGVIEDIVELTLNLKQLRFRLHSETPVAITLSIKGEKAVTGSDFDLPSQVELVNKDAYLATLTSKKAELKIDALVESGLGYVPVEEARRKEKVEIGMIALDAAFSPVRHVNYEVENMRVENRTDYNRLRLHVETDGSLTPREAFVHAVEILVAQWNALTQGFAHVFPLVGSQEKILEERETIVRDTVSENIMKTKLDELKISSRTLNALREAGVKTIAGMARKRESTLREIEGIGDKGIQEIKKALGNFGITIKQ